MRILSFLAAVFVGVNIGVGALPASASGGLASQLLADINSLRGPLGLGQITEVGALDQVATDWANHMARAGVLSHNPNMSHQVPAGWGHVGENVAYGPSSIDAVNAMFVASPAHYENLVMPQYTQVGLGIVAVNNVLWVVEDFWGPMSGPAPSASPPRTTRPAPAPAATPAPTTRPAPPTTRRPPAPATTAAPRTATPATTPAPTSPPPTAPPTTPATDPPVTATLGSDSRLSTAPPAALAVSHRSPRHPTGVAPALVAAVLLGSIMLAAMAGSAAALNRARNRP